MVSFKPSSKLKPLLSDPARPFIHRDLSWLQFNSRVLGEAKLKTNPLLERVKFLSISASNLDEFFMIRMASLRKSISTALRKDDKALVERLTRIRGVILNSVAKVVKQQTETCEALAEELKSEGVHIVKDLRESDEILFLGKKVFEEKILTELSPPEAFMPSLIQSLENLQSAVIFKSGHFFRIPKRLKPVVTFEDPASGKVYFFFLDQLLAMYLGPAFRLEDRPIVIRLTRDGDLTVDLEEEDPESIPDIMRSSIGKREKGRVVRLQYCGELVNELASLTQSILKLKSQQVFRAPRTFCFHGLWAALNNLPDAVRSKPGLQYNSLPGLIPKQFEATDSIFDNLKLRDYLLHHPYDSFDAYVNWMRAACDDTAVTKIELTVYRMDTLSPIIGLLKTAAASKTVHVVIELRARFDELNNLRLADELRKAGVEVTFGFGKLKVHAKVTLVTRLENGVEQRYTHLSTGNYNAVTARQYTDLAILTSDPVIGEDARNFFEEVWKGNVPQSFKRLVAAPTKLHRRMQQLIEIEMAAAKSGLPARIVVKVNALVDEAVIESLYRASTAGVKIDLIVRGACSLIPGIPGLSENIRVISIVDRFLEHSRIYYFESSKALYLSSADWMPRNFFSRLEVAFPVLDAYLYKYIEQTIIPAYLGDNTKARELKSDGTWKKRSPTPGRPELRSQFLLESIARRNYEGTPLEEKDLTLSPPCPPQQEQRA